MIQASEVRLDNLVLVHNGGGIRCIAKVNEISKSRTTYEWVKYDKRIEYGHKFYAPIPLTHRWLMKLGFTCNFSSDPQEGSASKIYKRKSFVIHQVNEDEEVYSFATYDDLIKIRYVHTLQNLYFTLTGEELTIQL